MQQMRVRYYFVKLGKDRLAHHHCHLSTDTIKAGLLQGVLSAHATRVSASSALETTKTSRYYRGISILALPLTAACTAIVSVRCTDK